MPAVMFEGNAMGPAVSLDMVQGGRLLDACDEARAPVAFSCRSASCGVCRVDVLAGREHLEPPDADELEVLQVFEATPSERLACQAVARAGPGIIRLRCVLAAP